MNINDIYNKVLLKKYTVDDLNWLLANTKMLCRSNQYCTIYYDIIKELEKNNEIDFINKFILICQSNKMNALELFRLAFDKSYMTPQNIELLLSKERSGSFRHLPNLYKILMKTVKQYCDKNTFENIIRNYAEKLANEYSDCETDEERESVISSIDLEIFGDRDDEYFLTCSMSYSYLWQDELFKKKVQEFFAKHPDKIIERGNIDYHILKFIRKNVVINGKLIDELFKTDDEFDNILINKCGYKNGWDQSQDALIKLYNYYRSKNQIDEINKLMSICFGKSIHNGKLYPKHGYEQFVINIIKSNYPINVYLNYEEIDTYYNELCQLQTKNVFVVFKNENFGSEKEIMSFPKYQKARNFYDNFSEEIKSYNFTPLEAYLYSYIKTRSFKSYKLYRDDEAIDQKRPQMSRNPFFIIDNDYIVCAGYSNFILEILKRLIISSSYLVIGKKECDGDSHHARVLAHLKDDFYNVDGVYIGEVTGSKNAVSETYSCLDAVLTKSQNSYNQYQIGENTRTYFLEAIRKLDVDDKYKSDDNSEFFDIINRPIPIEIINNAVINMFRKINPHMSEEDLINITKKYCYYNSNYISQLVHSDETLKKQLKDIEFDNISLSGYKLFDFNKFLENTNYNNVTFKNHTCWNIADKAYCYHISINDSSKSNIEIMDILSANKYLFENEYIQLYYDTDNDFPGIKLKVPTNFTGEMLRDIFVRAASTINEILTYDVTQTQDIVNNHGKRR